MNLQFLAKSGFTFLCCFLSFSIFSQTSGDCLGAIPVCDEIYIETSSPSGEGEVPDEINSALFGGGHVCCDFEDNSIWYTFTANADGELGFVIIPNNLDDDYDWALFNLTDAECEDLYDNEQLLVSCNAAGGFGCHGETGATGATNWNIQGAGCNVNPPSVISGFSPLNALIPVEKGNTYVLYISNWTGSTSGYTLDFSSSVDVGIYDIEAPEFTNITIPDCPGGVFKFFFNENIDCATVENIPIYLEGPGGIFDVNIIASGCVTGSTTQYIEFTVDGILSSGSYSLFMGNDDGLYFIDICGNPILSDTFEVAYEFSELDLGPDTSFCQGEEFEIKVNINDASYSWSDNSTEQSILVTEPGIYSVTVDDGCYIRVDSLEVTVDAAGDATIFELPGGFTPNNDEINPVYKIAYEDVEFLSYRLQIWNRWGEMVFETNDPMNGWDGRYKDAPSPSGIYLVYMEARIINCLGEESDRTEKRELLLLR